MSDLEGKLIGTHVIKERIGRGKMSSVYRAEHPDLGRQVAIKLLAPHLAMQLQIANRFRLEARLAAMLQHPNIIDIYDFGFTSDNVPYYVMELLRGRTLAADLAGKGQLSPHDALPYLKQICSALELAHGQGIVHRALRPSNIFVMDAEMLLIKILDFGLARMLETDEGVTLTSTGMLLADPAFISPEQAARDHNQISPRSDVYSLGALIYWMLCGAPPFVDDAPGLVLVMHMREPPPPLLTRRPDVPAPLAELVHWCLAKEPEQRPGTAGEVMTAYEEALSASMAGATAKMEAMLRGEPVALDPRPPGLGAGDVDSGLLAQLAGEQPETDDDDLKPPAVPEPATATTEPVQQSEPRPASSDGVIPLPPRISMPEVRPAPDAPAITSAAVVPLPPAPSAELSSPMLAGTVELDDRPTTRHQAVEAPQEPAGDDETDTSTEISSLDELFAGGYLTPDDIPDFGVGGKPPNQRTDDPFDRYADTTPGSGEGDKKE